MNFLNESKYYCKDVYLPELPKDLFLNQFFKLHHLGGECASYSSLRNFVHLSTSEPCIISPLIDLRESKLAYGALGIPKLLRETKSSDKMRAYQALNTLLSLLYRPEKVVEALRWNIVGRLNWLLCSKEDFLCQCALACLRVLSFQPNGKQAIIQNECALPILKQLLQDSIPDVRYHAILTISTLAVNYTAIHTMVEGGFLPVIINLINNENNPKLVLKQLLEILELLLDDGEKARVLAITCDALDIVGFFSHNDPEVRKAAAAVLAQLFYCPIGKIAATHRNILAIIKKKLNDPNEAFKSKLVTALMFATTDIEARKVAANLCILTDLLEIISNYHIPTELEISAIKVLTNLAELPQIRKKLKFFLGNILSLPRHNREDIQRHIDTLVDTILWEP